MSAKVHALKVAASRVLADIAAEAHENLRKEAEPVFADLRISEGAKSLNVALPDGTELGDVAILAGPAQRKFNMSAIAAIVANDNPDAFEEQLKPEALTDPALLTFVRDHMPHLLHMRINDDHLKKLFKRVDVNGYLKDAAGTRIKVAEITRGEPTGKFAYTSAPGAREAVWAAWASGELQPVIGELFRPAIEAGEDR
ncbi:hypothetical protein N5079_19575 [Planotetraspora sp. A-T 1434]|uniref:hypothetical protein n=1 Tax=Planotetraspora sp. A-T 1434 TaxID=2979219 RepID=UPI0021C0CECA|nr:hypothetical protein [Planotetraspora sp. A-T 1434]MCT9932404.1 hypothetical protein [Planotetraspora sp. A-T 1434]